MEFRKDRPIGLFFEDYEVGKKLITRGRTINEADIMQFGALTGDFNPMHFDAEYMKGHMLGQRVAHGMLVISYAVGQSYQLGILDQTILAFRSLDVKFSYPVYIGDTLHVELTVKEMKEAKRLGGGTVTIGLRVVNQDGKSVQKGEMAILVASKPAAEE
jgi:3-hydroxybutyryl-CoA dehydratase